MKELRDNEFDHIFKSKIAEGYLEYEEEAWLKMERKLRKRDRFVFYRNASILLIFLSIGLGIYMLNDKKTAMEVVKSARKIEKNNGEISNTPAQKQIATSLPKRQALHSRFSKHIFVNPIPEGNSTAVEAVNEKAQTEVVAQHSPSEISIAPKSQENIETLSDVKVNVARKKRPITLSLTVGPDFSSTENTIGGKSGASVGLSVNIPITNKMSVQTGLSYGTKNYEAQGYDYAFNNPNIVYSITGIDASCKVLEIPLRASYSLLENHKNSIDLNAGLSSYLMLKENYRFIYTASSGRKDRYLEERNANQHYLSVIDLSATYNMKLKNKKFALGIEPYVKIPISGIGEGRVPLKSSGISLKLNYEFTKK